VNTIGAWADIKAKEEDSRPKKWHGKRSVW
jgi:hypothetical protein